MYFKCLFIMIMMWGFLRTLISELYCYAFFTAKFNLVYPKYQMQMKSEYVELQGTSNLLINSMTKPITRQAWCNTINNETIESSMTGLEPWSP